MESLFFLPVRSWKMKKIPWKLQQRCLSFAFSTWMVVVAGGSSLKTVLWAYMSMRFCTGSTICNLIRSWHFQFMSLNWEMTLHCLVMPRNEAYNQNPITAWMKIVLNFFIIYSSRVLGNIVTKSSYCFHKHGRKWGCRPLCNDLP